MLHIDSIDQDTYLLLQELSSLNYLKEFALAGGTSLALQLGHRISIDLDFFTIDEFDSEKLLDHLISDFEVSNVTIAKNTLNLYIRFNQKNIKVDFLRHHYKLLDKYISKDKIRLYSINDIAAMKLNAIANRGSKKDFYDIYELLNSFSIMELLEFFKEKYQRLNAFTVVKSLDYFEDADLEPDPMSLKKINWKLIKEKVSNEVQKNF